MNSLLGIRVLYKLTFCQMKTKELKGLKIGIVSYNIGFLYSPMSENAGVPCIQQQKSN